jgi:anti-sigma regulatory factor (Ser/Thr protein kinase)
MEVTPSSIGISVCDPSAVAQARRQSAAIARTLGLPDSKSHDASIVVTEAATNILKHTPGGTIAMRAFTDASGSGLEILAFDRGPGMDVSRAVRDGYSTAGSPGTGLGAIARLADESEIYSAPGLGAFIMARFYRARTGVHSRDDQHHLDMVVGAICLPAPDEPVSGDGWSLRMDPGAVSLLVVDGLGHGPLAAEAARAGIKAFTSGHGSPRELLQSLSSAMAPTRGGSAAVARIEPRTGAVRYCGVGNIAGAIVTPDGQKNLVSHNGTLGREARKFEEYAYDWPSGATLIMHSDGLTSRWQVDLYPGILQRHPSILAAALYRDHMRGRDDATVVVARSILRDDQTRGT